MAYAELSPDVGGVARLASRLVFEESGIHVAFDHDGTRAALRGGRSAKDMADEFLRHERKRERAKDLTAGFPSSQSLSDAKGNKVGFDPLALKLGRGGGRIGGFYVT